MTNAPDVQYFVNAKMEELFMEWLDLPNTQKLIRRIISLANGGSTAGRVSSPTLSSISSRGSPTGAAVTLDDEVSLAPLPFFTTAGSAFPGSPTHSPRSLASPTSNLARASIPIPRSSPDAALASPPRSPSLPPEPVSDDSFNLPKAATPVLAVSTPSRTPRSAPVIPVSPVMRLSDFSSIPPFYFPAAQGGSLSEDELAAIDRLFSTEISSPRDLEEFASKSLGVSKYFASALFKRVQKLVGGTVGKSEFKQFFSSRLSLRDPVGNFFQIVRQEANQFITRNDLRELVWVLLESHPGLLFLRDSPEFQERYADTVICRIFFHVDRRRTGKIGLRDLRRCGAPCIVKAWMDLDLTEDINTVRQFFSYEHFYVLYCKFWDLDADHDFLIDKDDLVKYDGHAWSPKAIERVFSQAAMRFTSGVPSKMSYDDFVWFILADEDKTTEEALEFLFRLVDLDGDGVIRDHEMKYFYDEQVQRLECVNQEAPAFKDIMCQMTDLIKPAREGQFRLEEFVRKRKNNAGVFFSVLLSLSKFMHYEQRDPFQQKQDQLNNPDLTDWDRFCLGEYVRLAMEAGDSGQAGSSSEAVLAEDFLRNPDQVQHRPSR